MICCYLGNQEDYCKHMLLYEHMTMITNMIASVKSITVHIQGRLITGLYSNNVAYVLAQVESLVFRKQSAQSKLLVDKILDSPPVPKT